MFRSPTGIQVAILLVLRTGFAAEFPEPQAPAAAAAARITINIIEGDGAILNIRQRVSREPIVQVEDENHKPVAGALVTFASPHNGPSALFLNNSHTYSVLTDEQGKAALRGMTPNQSSGNFEIQVSARKDNLSARTTISISNVLPAGVSALTAAGLTTKALIGIAAFAGVALGVGLGIGLTSGGHTTAPAGGGPIVLQPGTPSVGGPR